MILSYFSIFVQLQTTASSVTLPLPTIAAALITLFFAGWMTGGGGHVQFDITTIVIILVAMISITLLLAKLSGKTSSLGNKRIMEATTQSLENENSEVVLRAKSRTKTRSRSISGSEVLRAGSDSIYDDDSQ